MKHHLYPTRDPIKNFFPLPNELFHLKLSAGEIAVYAYLMYREDRRNYTCVVSYREIGAAVGMSKNTVSKYVAKLEERGLIETEHTHVITQDGKKGNGRLRYRLLPIQIAVDRHNADKLAQLELETARYNLQKAQARRDTLAGNLPSSQGTTRGPHRNPAERLRWGEEERRNERALPFAAERGI